MICWKTKCQPDYICTDRPSQPAELHKKKAGETDAVNETKGEGFLTCAGVFGANPRIKKSLDYIHTTHIYEWSLFGAQMWFFLIMNWYYDLTEIFTSLIYFCIGCHSSYIMSQCVLKLKLKYMIVSVTANYALNWIFHHI